MTQQETTEVTEIRRGGRSHQPRIYKAAEAGTKTCRTKAGLTGDHRERRAGHSKVQQEEAEAAEKQKPE
jgi:hypothetical protein